MGGCFPACPQSKFLRQGPGRRHEFLRFDITELLSVLTKLSNISDFFIMTLPSFPQAIFHISADINTDNDGRDGAALQAQFFFFN